jgi:hypothetical protein
MPIITKPSPLEKNATGVFSLDKTALALHPIVVASSHFSSPNVWDKIIVKYKSETLGQFESIEFDASLASPEGQFFVSETAEDIFEIEKITIIDKDGAILLIPRAELTVAEFDIDFGEEEPEIGDPITWVVPDPTAYNLLPNGGVEIGPNRSSFSFPFPPFYLIYATPQHHFSGDFNVVYEITSGTGYDYNAGMDIPNSYGSFTGLSVGNDLLLSVFFAGTKIKSVGSNGFDGGKVRIQRSGSIVSVYFNDVLEHSGTLTTTLSPSCTIMAGDTRKILYAKILD